MRALFAGLLFVLVAASVDADERFLPYIEWITEHSVYEYNGEELPTVETMPYAWLEVTIHGPQTVAKAEMEGRKLPEIYGSYDHNQNVMMFPDTVDPWAEEETIVHELVHYLQFHSDRWNEDCLAANEREAYELHWEWVETHDYEAEEPNWLYVFLIGMSCRDHPY